MKSNLFILVLIAVGFSLSLFVPDIGCEVAVIPALIGAAGSIFGGFVNGIGQADANEANDRLNRLNREWQSAENQKNRDWQEKMWNAQNMYNTPSAMMERYKQAGLNPFLVGNETGIGQAGSAGSPSMTGAPSAVEQRPVNPLMGVAPAFNAYLQSKSVDANVANSTAQSMKEYAQAYSLLANTGMKHEEIIKTLRPFTSSFDGSIGSDSVQQKLSNDARQSLLQGDRQELENRITRLYGFEKAQLVNRNLTLANDKTGAEIDRIMMQNKVSVQDIKESVSRIAANYAQAFNLQKQGEYYICSADQYKIINESLQLDLQEKYADFAFNTDVRKFKKDITHRGIALGLFTGGIDAKDLNQRMESNEFLKYGSAASQMIGNIFKINVGLNSSNATFTDKTPRSNPMFYSGDGFRMQGGVLMKDNW